MIQQAKQYDNEELATLCEACVQAITQLTKPSLLALPHDWRYVIHHQTFSALRSAAESQDCRLCHLLFEVVQRELKDRYSTEDILPALIEQCNGEVSFAFHPETQHLDKEIAPISRGLQTVRYCAFREQKLSWGSGLNYGLYDGIKLSIERVAGGGVALLGRQIATLPDFELARGWIENCNKLHRKCPSINKTTLPTRILDLGTDKNDNGNRVTLREGLQRRECYVALSHCWGSREPRLLLTDSTRKQLLQGVPCSDLEQNFQDAVRVTRALGYRYLWIDSLCIIQKSKDKVDWAKECPRMGDYYSNAAVTIAATDAKDAYAGFYHSRESWQDLVKPMLCRMFIDGKGVIARITNRPTYDPSDRASGTLHTRAWVFQERHLSPRMLNFGSQKMFFECASSEQHESLHYPCAQFILPRSQLMSKECPISSEEELAQCTDDYYSMVWQYCRCSLTKVEDRLPAFSAIARRYQERTGGEYVAGIWMQSIARALAWARDKPKAVVEDHSRGQAAPSWSWAACKERLEFLHTRESLVTLECAAIWLKTSDDFGEVDLGVLKITGSLFEAELRHSSESDPDLWHCGYCTVFPDRSEIGRGTCACDDRGRCAAMCNGYSNGIQACEERVTCLSLATGAAYGTAAWFYLILEPCSENPDVYRRMGIAWHANDHERPQTWVTPKSSKCRTIYLK